MRVKNNQEAHQKSYSKELRMVHMVEICGPAIEDHRFPKGPSTVFFVSGHTYLSSSKNFNIVCSCKAIYQYDLQTSCVMLLVSVMGIKPKQEGASFDIVVVVDPLSKGNNATPFFSCTKFFLQF